LTAKKVSQQNREAGVITTPALKKALKTSIFFSELEHIGGKKKAGQSLEPATVHKDLGNMPGEGKASRI